jgi:hypothetical protein
MPRQIGHTPNQLAASHAYPYGAEYVGDLGGFVTRPAPPSARSAVLASHSVQVASGSHRLLMSILPDA